jgi:hypothetical protein
MLFTILKTMTLETKDYIETWTKKIKHIEGDSLGAVFEKFSTLYTLHNRLYNDSYRILEQSGKLAKRKYRDHEKASIAIIEYLSADLIINSFNRNGNLIDLASIAELIHNNVFYINLADGKANPEVDNQLMNNLRSADSEILSKAALMVIYNLRNNVVHGEKHFEEYQRMLLEPLIRILQTIIDLQIESYK